MRNQDPSQLPGTWQDVHSVQYQNTLLPDQHCQDQEQEQIEKLQDDLRTYEIQKNDWVYYLTEPEQWDMDNGSRAVLLKSAPCLPIWVNKESEQKFKNLRAKMRQLWSVCEQIKEFKEAPDPSDHFFKDSIKEARRKAERLDQEVKTAGKEINKAVECSNFDSRLNQSIRRFKQKVASNKDATMRVEELTNKSIENGIGIDSTNISIDQILPKLPEFSSTTTRSILDALDTWKTRLASAGINRTTWGGVVIRRLKSPSLDILLPTVRREQKYEDIVSALVKRYGRSLEVKKRFIEAHKTKGVIPDPPTYPKLLL